MASYLTVSTNRMPSLNVNGVPVIVYDIGIRQANRAMFFNTNGSFLGQHDYSVDPEERQIITLQIEAGIQQGHAYIENVLASMRIRPMFWGFLTQEIIRKASREVREHNYMYSIHVRVDMKILLKELVFTIASGDSLDESCPICLEDLSGMREQIKTPCDHLFHKECFVRWLESDISLSCPLCRFCYD